MNRAKRKTRHQALYSESISRSEEGCLPLALDFHPAFSGISSILTEHQPILSNCSTTKEIFSDKPFISYRRPRNLKDSFVRPKLTKNVNSLEQVGMLPCGKSRCQICEFIPVGRTFSDSLSKHTFYINHRFNCDSVGVVYLLLCKRCDKQYVGSTTTNFVYVLIIIRVV